MTTMLTNDNLLRLCAKGSALHLLPAMAFLLNALLQSPLVQLMEKLGLSFSMEHTSSPLPMETLSLNH